LKRLAFFLILLQIVSACKDKKTEKKLIAVNPAYDKAYQFRNSGIADSAFINFDIAKDVFLQRDDSLGVGKCLLNMAIIACDKSDNLGGQELSLNAEKYFNPDRKNHHVYISSNNNNLGIVTYRLHDLVQALRFYNIAIKYSQSDAETKVYWNNIGTIYRERNDFSKAIKAFNKALAGKRVYPKEYARALCNLAITKWQINPAYNAVPEMQKAIDIRLKQNDNLGLNASYYHFSSYYEKTAPAVALKYAQKMYAVAQLNQRADDQLSALQKIIRLSPGETSKRYFSIYERKEDSLTTVNNASKNQFALIRYEVEKNKADNLAMQKDNQTKQYQIMLLAGGLLITIVGGVFIYRRRQLKIALSAKNAIRENQLRTSKKVHDVVANGLYQVMTEMENKPGIDREYVLNKIEDLYEKSRDISYEKPLSPDQPYHQLVSELLSSFASDNTKVLIAGNSAELWDKVADPVRYEVLQILQELMINMKKHSAAGNAVIRFEREGSIIKIYYTDNGKGMEKGAKFNNGLRNTGNRIDSISGAITFDSVPGRGLKIEIFFPVP
jgi:tetratricopeptide (TPR) repeat protein